MMGSIFVKTMVLALNQKQAHQRQRVHFAKTLWRKDFALMEISVNLHMGLMN
jgi:hypothetical protein